MRTLASFTFLIAFSAFGQEGATVTEISPSLLVFATSSGNVIVSVGKDGALVIGTPSAASTVQIEKAIEAKTKSPLRYVVMAEPRHGQLDGDAGWGKLGAFVAMQEKGLERLGGHTMGHAAGADERLAQLGVDRPRVAYSKVITFDMNEDAIHVVHQAPGYSDADVLVHFHVGKVAYMGNVFPGDSYPDIDPKFGANLNGFVDLLGHWMNEKMRVVPAQGPVGTGADVKKYRDMIVAVKGKVQHVIDGGGNVQDAIAAHPTAEFDATWRKGRVKADDFVRASTIR